MIFSVVTKIAYVPTSDVFFVHIAECQWRKRLGLLKNLSYGEFCDIQVRSLDKDMMKAAVKPLTR